MITQLNGIVADMEPIKDFCDRVIVMEILLKGLELLMVKNIRSWGVGGCLSFYPAKVAGGIETEVQLSQITIN